MTLGNFDEDARRVWSRAGEIAAGRARVEQGVGLGEGVPVRDTLVGNVTITPEDLSAALALEEDSTAYLATVSPAIAHHLSAVPLPGAQITVSILWEVLRCSA